MPKCRRILPRKLLSVALETGISRIRPESITKSLIAVLIGWFGSASCKTHMTGILVPTVAAVATKPARILFACINSLSLFVINLRRLAIVLIKEIKYLRSKSGRHVNRARSVPTFAHSIPSLFIVEVKLPSSGHTTTGVNSARLSRRRTISIMFSAPLTVPVWL